MHVRDAGIIERWNLATSIEQFLAPTGTQSVSIHLKTSKGLSNMSMNRPAFCTRPISVSTKYAIGGFSQFFSNSTGVLAPEAVEGFKAIGKPVVAGSVEQTMSLLGLPVSEGRRLRSDRKPVLQSS